MKNDLSNNSVREKLIDEMQEELLRKEIRKEPRLVDYIKQEMLWGSSKEQIFKEIRKDYKISQKELDNYYDQAFNLLDKGKWI